MLVLAVTGAALLEYVDPRSDTIFVLTAVALIGFVVLAVRSARGFPHNATLLVLGLIGVAVSAAWFLAILFRWKLEVPIAVSMALLGLYVAQWTWKFGRVLRAQAHLKLGGLLIMSGGLLALALVALAGERACHALARPWSPQLMADFYRNRHLLHQLIFVFAPVFCLAALAGAHRVPHAVIETQPQRETAPPPPVNPVPLPTPQPGGNTPLSKATPGASAGFLETNWWRVLRNLLLGLAAYALATAFLLFIGVILGWFYGLIAAVAVIFGAWAPCAGFLVVYAFTSSRCFLWRWFLAVPLMALAGVVTLWHANPDAGWYYLAFAAYPAVYAALACAFRLMVDLDLDGRAA